MGSAVPRQGLRFPDWSGRGVMLRRMINTEDTLVFALERDRCFFFRFASLKTLASIMFGVRDMRGDGCGAARRRRDRRCVRGLRHEQQSIKAASMRRFDELPWPHRPKISSR